MRWKQHRPIIHSSIRTQMERPTPSRYLLHFLTREAVSAELLRLQHAPQRRARHRPSHRALSTSEPLMIHRPAPIRREERPTAHDSHYAPRAVRRDVGCEGCGMRGHTAAQCKSNRHPNWNAQHATVKWKDTAVAQEIRLLTNGEVRSLPPDGVQWLPADKVWIGGEQLRAWKARITAPFKRSHKASSAEGNPPDQNRGKSIHLGVHWVWFFPVCPSCPILPGINLSLHA
jgi:hypothetical protein